ncbi:MAG: hypothetical protein L0154_03625 [Chloroflexi bacterium]|nr:hypothetical protein [Chloroflexota bacterium]
MSELRDFFYLDISKVHSFVSQIHGGLVSEINETIKRIGGFSAGINLGSLPVGGRVDASKAKESEQQQTIQLTPEAYFSILHKYLQNENEIDDLENIEDNQLQVGQFVEIGGIANPPIIDA